MAETGDEAEHDWEAPAPRQRRRRRSVLAIAAALLVALLAYGWFTRVDLADRLLTSQLDSLGIPATYRIESIGPRHQVLTEIVVGDPDRPDLTIERAEIRIDPQFGLPVIGSARLVRPRLYGTLHDGKLSFGSLDKVIFAKRDTPQGLPDMELALVDGRALIVSDYGPIGAKTEGAGSLHDGFQGLLAVNAPLLQRGGCTASQATLFGTIHVSDRKPAFKGPLRIGPASCADGTRFAGGGASLSVTLAELLDGATGDVDLRLGAANSGTNRLSGVQGKGHVEWQGSSLTARYDLAALGLVTAPAVIGRLNGTGRLRARDGFARLEWEADWDGTGLRLGTCLGSTLEMLVRSGEGSLVGELAQAVGTALRKEERGSTFAANTVLRLDGDENNLIIPTARLRGGSGQTLLALSRVRATAKRNDPLRLLGNFSTGGAGLPQITGRMERDAAGRAILALTMPEYAARESRLAIPQLLLVQNDAGALGFSGSIRADGPLPGGMARGLTVPLSGNWSSQSGLALWRSCTRMSFDALQIGGIAMERRGLTLCPGRNGAILRSDAGGTRIAAGSPGLDLAGHLGDSPVRITSGPLGLAFPGSIYARKLNVLLGPEETGTRFSLDDVHAQLGAEVAGRFADADISLASVPLDLLDAAGAWRFAGGRLELSGVSMRVEDREALDRFEPMVARDARLTLTDNMITADTLLREPVSGRVVTGVTIAHDLGSGAGHADLAVDRLVFDNALQPDMLTGLALGVVANARGTVTGRGRIDWNESGVTSSGQFSTDDLDFAAAFGPVEGVAGTIRFTDLLGLVTAPGQRLTIRSINPGIEVNDGVLLFALVPGNRMAVEGASWPFMGGQLRMQPVTIPLSASEERRFTLEITGLDAASFVERMELSNLAATGTFDGTLPLVFDKDGGHLQGGLLVSRPPGGNVAYVGALSYKDLSPMANYAFDALKSLNYSEMRIGMDGELTGELVTRVRFEGVKQGAGTKQNFLTRQVAKLPVRFNVNVRAPFYKLITSVKAMYDPAFIRDPREIGLIDSTGKALRHEAAEPCPCSVGNSNPSGESPVQAPARETMP